jgi:multidrug efflux pump subunit AcrB
MKYFSSFLIVLLLLACTDNNSDLLGSIDMEESMIENVMSQKQVYLDKPQEQKLIKESYLNFETQDLDKTYSIVIRFVKQNGGFIQDDNSNKSYNRISRQLVVRLPSVEFQKTIDSISNYVSFFDTKRISSRDVTEEFIDIEARLNAKQTLEKRYLELLSKAKNVKEILDIERELSKIREEIEAKQGRLKYLNNKVSLSTINIEFYKLTAESGVTVSYGAKMWNAIKSGFNGISLFFLGILHIWPLIIIMIFMFFFIKRWLRK